MSGVTAECARETALAPEELGTPDLRASDDLFPSPDCNGAVLKPTTNLHLHDRLEGDAQASRRPMPSSDDPGREVELGSSATGAGQRLPVIVVCGSSPTKPAARALGLAVTRAAEFR
jgi:hypothetical protein